MENEYTFFFFANRNFIQRNLVGFLKLANIKNLFGKHSNTKLLLPLFQITNNKLAYDRIIL